MMDPVSAISPIDGRYASKLDDLRPIFSEFALLKSRVEVEIKWLMELADNPDIKEISSLNAARKKALNFIWQEFTENDAKEIKRIEVKVLHDLKALEIWLGKKLSNLGMDRYISFIHFGCTSEDINNLSYALMLNKGRDLLLQDILAIRAKLVEMSERYAKYSMTGRTHGQEATPTTMGKEMAVFAYRLSEQARIFSNLALCGKLNGATGNYNTWLVAYPSINWQSVSNKFVEKTLGLKWNPYSTQIESHDNLSELLSSLARIDIVLVDMCRDLWSYIGLGYFALKKNEGEVGSSTMPHKINPEKFENAEGNLEMASSMASFLAMRLPLSRWQRDLSDSTLQRNLGSVFAHSLLGYRSCLAGLDRISAVPEVISADLMERWSLLSEPVQTMLRKAGRQDAYDKIKRAVRGKNLDRSSYLKLVESCNLDEKTQAALIKLRPDTYTGLATRLAKGVKKHCK